MTASSNVRLDFSDREDLVWLARMLADVAQAAHEAEPLIVGALARDLLLFYGHGIRAPRATEDVDLALAVESWKAYATLRESLLAGGAFRPHTGAAQKLRHREFGWLDVIPFGAVEQPGGTIAWPPDGAQVMAVLGYAEANASATTIVLPQGQAARVVSLPMLATLKLLAWQDRHLVAPDRDASDVRFILRNYLEAGNADRFYTEMSHLLNDDFDFEATGAWLAGHDARALILQHGHRADLLLRTLSDLLRREVDPNGALTLVTQMSATAPENSLQLLLAFHRGLTGEDAL